MNSAAGDCGDVLEAYPGANPPKISYVNRYDLAKNSFGPCDIRISAAHTNGLEVRLIGRLEVLNSKQVDGYWIPTSVELRRFEPTGIEQSESTLLSIFRVSVDSFRKLGQLPSMVPKMERTTSTVDYRTGQTWEYIADQWKTETQASELMKSGNALLYPAPGTSTSGVGSSFILGGLIFVLAATTIMLKRMATRKQNITTS